MHTGASGRVGYANVTSRTSISPLTAASLSPDGSEGSMSDWRSRRLKSFSAASFAAFASVAMLAAIPRGTAIMNITIIGTHEPSTMRFQENATEKTSHSSDTENSSSASFFSMMKKVNLPIPASSHIGNPFDIPLKKPFPHASFFCFAACFSTRSQ